MLRVFCTLLSVSVLAGCAVVDLAAHGVKKYEKSKEQVAQEQATPVSSSEPQPAKTVTAEPFRPNEAVPVASSGAIRSQPLD